MYPITVSKKTGYRATSYPIVIKDSKYNDFFETKPDTETFNLPPGNYMVEKGTFAELAAPVKYKLFRMPWPERFFYPIPYNYEVVFAPNPSKCSIFWDVPLIVFDTSYQNASQVVLDFLYFHEVAHCRYKTEKYCDLYAANEMLKAGYNPIQIGLAPALTLSEAQDDRVNYLINKLQAA